MTKNTAGILSFLGTLFVAGCIGAHYGNVSAFWNDLGLFLSGRGTEISRVTDVRAETLVSGTLFMAAVSVSVGLVIFLIVLFFLGEADTPPFRPRRKRDVKLFRMLFVVVLLEELFARVLFLGFLRQIPFLSGTFGLYALFFLGNGLWAYAHLGNYFFEEDRHWSRVLPQFAGGVIDTIAYLKWGLVGAMLVHFTHNAIVFASAKSEDVRWSGWMTHFVAGGLMFVIAVAGFDKSFSDVSAWFTQDKLEPLKGWSLGDYAWCLLLVSTGTHLISLLLFYDQVRINAALLNKRGPLYLALALIFTVLTMTVLVPVSCYAVYWCLGTFVTDVTERIAAAILLLALLDSSSSMSRTVKSYWRELTYSSLYLCVVIALGLGPAMEISLYLGLGHLPAILILMFFPAGEE